ncbi:MAG: hypothetical protein U1E62_21495 [Alsobacter sp.]
MAEIITFPRRLTKEAIRAAARAEGMRLRANPSLLTPQGIADATVRAVVSACEAAGHPIVLSRDDLRRARAAIFDIMDGRS